MQVVSDWDWELGIGYPSQIGRFTRDGIIESLLCEGLSEWARRMDRWITYPVSLSKKLLCYSRQWSGLLLC